MNCGSECPPGAPDAPPVHDDGRTGFSSILVWARVLCRLSSHGIIIFYLLTSCTCNIRLQTSIFNPCGWRQLRALPAAVANALSAACYCSVLQPHHLVPARHLRRHLWRTPLSWVSGGLLCPVHCPGRFYEAARRPEYNNFDLML